MSKNKQAQGHRIELISWTPEDERKLDEAKARQQKAEIDLAESSSAVRRLTVQKERAIYALQEAMDYIRRNDTLIKAEGLLTKVKPKPSEKPTGEPAENTRETVSITQASAEEYNENAEGKDLEDTMKPGSITEADEDAMTSEENTETVEVQEEDNETSENNVGAGPSESVSDSVSRNGTVGSEVEDPNESIGTDIKKPELKPVDPEKVKGIMPGKPAAQQNSPKPHAGGESSQERPKIQMVNPNIDPDLSIYLDSPSAVMDDDVSAEEITGEEEIKGEQADENAGVEPIVESEKTKVDLIEINKDAALPSETNNTPAEDTPLSIEGKKKKRKFFKFGA